MKSKQYALFLKLTLGAQGLNDTAFPIFVQRELVRPLTESFKESNPRYVGGSHSLTWSS